MFYINWTKAKIKEDLMSWWDNSDHMLLLSIAMITFPIWLPIVILICLIWYPEGDIAKAWKAAWLDIKIGFRKWCKGWFDPAS